MRELFSRRNRDRSQDPEVYIYESFSESFRNQCFLIIQDIVSDANQNPYSHRLEKELCACYAREKGMKELVSPAGYSNILSAMEKYIDECSDCDFLDFLDYCFGVMEEPSFTRKYGYNYGMQLEKSIGELNLRFRQHFLGYEFINGEIIPKTNEFTHQEIIKPALRVLNDDRFQGANDEYLTAFDHLRAGNNKDAILNAGKAFESTMKVICTEMRYSFEPNKDAAKNLVQVLKQNDFFPPYLESYLNNLCAILGEGASVVRNKESGHGQGEEVRSTADEYVEYVLNSVASNIVFLYRLFKSKEGVK